MKNLQTIANLINNFDTYYEMSDSDRTYNDGRESQRSISRLLEELTTNELVELKSLTTIGEDMLMRYFSEYFENLPEPTKPETKLSKIMSTAWSYLKKGIFTNMSQALRAAWAKFKIVSRLKSSVVNFTYRKANGELREAIGTLRDGNFQYETKGSNRKEKPDVISYYDLGVQGWRAFRIERLVQA